MQNHLLLQNQVSFFLIFNPIYTFIDHPTKKHASNYKLYGISHHSGSLYGGHYIAEVQNVDNGNWYNCNDSFVSKQGKSYDNQSASAYVLFYV